MSAPEANRTTGLSAEHGGYLFGGGGLGNALDRDVALVQAKHARLVLAFTDKRFFDVAKGHDDDSIARGRESCGRVAAPTGEQATRDT